MSTLALEARALPPYLASAPGAEVRHNRRICGNPSFSLSRLLVPTALPGRLCSQHSGPPADELSKTIGTSLLAALDVAISGL